MITVRKLFIAILSVLFFLPGTGTLTAQNDSTDDQLHYITISGVVKDKKNKKELEYVNIAIPGSTTGTVTNADGEFLLKVRDSIQARKVIVSHLGYFSSEIALNGTNLENLTVWLIPHANLLDEVVVRAQDPRILVEEAIKKIPENYNPKGSLLTGFYRETAQKGKNYINISEVIIDIYKASYSQLPDRDRVQIYKGRKLLSQKRGDTLAVKFLGGPNLSIYMDIVKNPDVILSREALSYYSYHMEEGTAINNRPQYVISFRPQAILPYALYYGKLYIDRENLAFSRAEIFLDMDDRNKATQAILRKKPFGLRFKPIEVSYLVNYTERDGKTYLSYIRNNVRFKCDWKRKLFSTNYTILSEMVVTDSKEGGSELMIPYKMSFKQTQALSDKLADFMDEDFWGAYNIIEPTESLEHAVKKLKKQQE